MLGSLESGFLYLLQQPPQRVERNDTSVYESVERIQQVLC
jgi:hypothetical protein